MEVKEVKDKNIWESFLFDCQEKTLLQSWDWGEFQKNMGNKIWRLAVYNDGHPLSVILVVKIIAKRGTFLLAQHGPCLASRGIYNFQYPASKRITNSKFEILKLLLQELKKIGKEEGASFIRIAPLWEKGKENNRIFKDSGFHDSPMHANAYEATWKLDLALPEEKILKDMRKTTRYLIRQAQKNNDIEIFQRWDLSDVEIFNKIHQEVVKAQKFTPFSLKYFKNEFLSFQKDDQARLFFGKYKGEVIASAFVVFWSNIGFYHHAALLPQYHKIPIAYSLLFEAIKEAKKRGCVLFDFWGYVNPFEKPNHPWAGPTLFKMGFGGKAYEYVKVQDCPLSKKYWLIYVFEKLRKIKRGL